MTRCGVRFIRAHNRKEVPTVVAADDSGHRTIPRGWASCNQIVRQAGLGRNTDDDIRADVEDASATTFSTDAGKVIDVMLLVA